MLVALPPQPTYTIRGRDFDFNKMVVVMAILNRTPDSFHDRGATFDLEIAVEAALRASTEGAHWIDIGAVPFSPIRARLVSEDEELDRVVPLVQRLRSEGLSSPLSIDTVRPEVARQALDAGADIINDTSGLHDPEMAKVVARARAYLIIGHSLASPPHTLVTRPEYHDVVTEVFEFLRARTMRARDAGMSPNRLIIDPALDLNKNTHHSLGLLRGLDKIATLGYPMLAALSRKHFIAETIGVERDEMSVAGTVAANTAAVFRGARILRVHDVVAGVETARMAGAAAGLHGPSYARHNVT